MEDIIGKQFGRLTVLCYSHSDKNYNKFYKCLCACGNVAHVQKYKLVKNTTQSCGCYGKEFRDELKQKAKQERRKITRRAYQLMIQKCYDPLYISYKHYGEVGIKVCDSWLNGDGKRTAWECFFADMGAKPKNKVLGRKDKLKDYTPDNCCWTNPSNQWADMTRSGRPRQPPKIDTSTDEEKWVKRCIKHKMRRHLTKDMLLPLLVTHCPILGLELTYTMSGTRVVPNNYATLDRIDSNKGYELGNIQILSHRANMLKSDATKEELQLVLASM